MTFHRRHVRALKRAAAKSPLSLRAYMRKATKRSGERADAAAKWLRLKGSA